MEVLTAIDDPTFALANVPEVPPVNVTTSGEITPFSCAPAIVAVKFTSYGFVVTVAPVTDNAAAVMLAVSDDGCVSE
jgi:hypothetical protein